LLPLVDGRVDERPLQRHPGVVEQHVDAAERRDRLLDDALDLFRIADVRRQRDRGAAQVLDLLRDRVGGLGPQVGEREGGALAGEQQRGRRPDATARAGDDRDLAVEPSDRDRPFTPPR
jgi:hypothetical protein